MYCYSLGHNYLKDLILGLIVLVAMVGLWFSNVQKRKAQKQMESMIKDVEFLQDAEKNLSRLQNRYRTFTYRIILPDKTFFTLNRNFVKN